MAARKGSELAQTAGWIGGAAAGFAVIMSAITAFSWSAGFAIRSADAECVGQVVKISRRGVVWKTWEAEFALTQDGVYHRTFHVSVDEASPDRDRLVAELTAAWEDGRIVVLEYGRRMGSRPWRCDTSALVKSVGRLPSRR